jgi:hypothetical protein
MAKIKGILAVGVILLFMGLAFSPVTAQTITKDQLDVSAIGDLAPLPLSEKDISIMEKFLPTLLEKMQTATSYSELLSTVQSFMKEYGRHPILMFLNLLLMKAIHFNNRLFMKSTYFNYKFNQFRAIRRNAFVISWGFKNKLLPVENNKVNMVRSMTGWYYSGRSNVVLNSRTMIIDPYPFSIKILTGRQIGLMSNFIGLYIHRSGGISDKTMTFFFGYAQTIRGFDLSP